MHNKKLEDPLNANERYLHAIAVRLDYLISLIEQPKEVKEEEQPILVDEPVVEEVSTQCQGVTSKGAQCKRDAQEGSSYCSAHEPKKED